MAQPPEVRRRTEARARLEWTSTERFAWRVRDGPNEQTCLLVCSQLGQPICKLGGGEDGLKSHGQSGAVPFERTLSARVRQLGRPPMIAVDERASWSVRCDRLEPLRSRAGSLDDHHSRDGRNDASPRAAGSRGSDRQPSGPRPAKRGSVARALSARAIERDPSPQGEGAAQNLERGGRTLSESPDLMRAWHRARRHQGQALRVVAKGDQP